MEEAIVNLQQALQLNYRRLEKSCASCHAQGPLHLCTGCKNIYYCSSLCQKSDWRGHKNKCSTREKYFHQRLSIILDDLVDQIVKSTDLKLAEQIAIPEHVLIFRSTMEGLTSFNIYQILMQKSQVWRLVPLNASSFPDPAVLQRLQSYDSYKYMLIAFAVEHENLRHIGLYTISRDSTSKECETKIFHM